MEEQRIVDVGHVVRGMLAQPVDFAPGPMTCCSRRMSMVTVGMHIRLRQINFGYWKERRFAEVEALHQACVSAQVQEFVQRVAWVRLTALGVAVLRRALRLWVQALDLSCAMATGQASSPGQWAVFAAKVALYLADDPYMEVPSAVNVKLMEVPKAGQPGLGMGGVPLIMEKKLVVQGTYNGNEPERKSALIWH